MAALAASILVVGFSFNPGSPDATHMKRWTMPILSDSSEGLGGGIAFAWDPSIFDTILPNFREDAYLLDVNVIFSERLLPLTLTVLTLDIAYLVLLLRAHPKAGAPRWPG